MSEKLCAAGHVIGEGESVCSRDGQSPVEVVVEETGGAEEVVPVAEASEPQAEEAAPETVSESAEESSEAQSSSEPQVEVAQG